jgi:hypothetical protein
MVTRADRILDTIDAGLQSSDETDYGFDREGCVRCRGAVEEGDFCPSCRAFLLEDSDEDPTRGVLWRVSGMTEPGASPRSEPSVDWASPPPRFRVWNWSRVDGCWVTVTDASA